MNNSSFDGSPEQFDRFSGLAAVPGMSGEQVIRFRVLRRPNGRPQRKNFSRRPALNASQQHIIAWPLRHMRRPNTKRFLCLAFANQHVNLKGFRPIGAAVKLKIDARG